MLNDNQNYLMRGWDQIEIQFVENNYKKLSDLQLAEKLNRTEHSVQKKRLRLRFIRIHRGTPCRAKLKRMQELILVCENPNTGFYKLSMAKEELKKLSGL